MYLDARHAALRKRRPAGALSDMLLAVIGTLIDKYEVLQKLGEGATATVYRGRHLTIGNDVAIKVLHPHLSASKRYRERFNREARAVGRLSHPNIVSILDYSGQSADDCYIVTELVDGVTLLGLLQEHGTLPSELAAVIGMELCGALGFAHTAQVIHRDIKPENVMIRRDGKIKLMDFGVARVLDEGSITLDGSLLGSPAYMSPQQAQDQPLDGRSDLFSLGTVLFHAVTGHVPFSGGNTSVILKNIIDGNRPDVLELAPGASPAFAAVVDTLLQGRPDDRYANAEAVRTALLATLTEVELTLDHPALQVAQYLLNPEGCAAAIRAHLEPVLLRKGKERLAAGDHLGALQLFNRLLALDENNAEVLSLIQALHQPATSAEPPRRWVALAACALALFGALGVWGLSALEAPPTSAPVVAAATPTPVPTSNAPAVTAAATGGTLQSASPTPAAVSVAVPTASPRPRAVNLPLAPASVTSAVAPAVTAPVAAPSAVAPSSGALIIRQDAPVDVFIDGKMVGSQHNRTPSTEWVAIARAPLSVSAGHHTVTLKNPYAEDWQQEFDIAAGQTLEIPARLERKKVTVVIHPDMPGDCTYSVGAVPYGPVAKVGQFELPDPPPGTQMVFTCGSKKIVATLPSTHGGETIIVPVSVTP
jgi:serine/threonine-protein kinase